MVGWHHWLSGHELEQTPGESGGQRSLVCCSSWGHKTRTWLSNWTTTNYTNTLNSFLGSPSNCVSTIEVSLSTGIKIPFCLFRSSWRHLPWAFWPPSMWIGWPGLPPGPLTPSRLSISSLRAPIPSFPGLMPAFSWVHMLVLVAQVFQRPCEKGYTEDKFLRPLISKNLCLQPLWNHDLAAAFSQNYKSNLLSFSFHSSLLKAWFRSDSWIFLWILFFPYELGIHILQNNILRLFLWFCYCCVCFWNYCGSDIKPSELVLWCFGYFYLPSLALCSLSLYRFFF